MMMMMMMMKMTFKIGVVSSAANYTPREPVF
jgi:hypothetical protein